MRKGLNATLVEMQEQKKLSKQIDKILDHIRTWMTGLTWARLDDLSKGKEAEWLTIEGGALHHSPTMGLLESTHAVASKYYPGSPDPDRNPERTRKNSAEGIPAEGVLTFQGANVSKKLPFEQIQLTPGKPGPSQQGPEDE
eukprot:4974320-Karenia_brevis.AAC.1